jgi:hypothetical protein
MKISTAKKNVEILTKMWDLVMELDGMPTGHLEDAINEGLADMKTQLRWSLVYHLSEDNETDNVLFEGSDADCADYIIDHPELKGHCIIYPNY